jgi:hypothetical protein
MVGHERQRSVCTIDIFSVLGYCSTLILVILCGTVAVAIFRHVLNLLYFPCSCQVLMSVTLLRFIPQTGPEYTCTEEYDHDATCIECLVISLAQEKQFYILSTSCLFTVTVRSIVSLQDAPSKYTLFLSPSSTPHTPFKDP